MEKTKGTITIIDHSIGAIKKVVVAGYLYRFHDYNFIVHRDDYNNWTMTELVTGLRVTEASTRYGVIAKGQTILEAHKDKLGDVIQRQTEYLSKFSNYNF